MKKILVIDDEENIRWIIATFFEHHGYETVQAKNGLEGILLLGKEQPDLVITDVEMPEMSGDEVVRHIRAECALPIKTIVISGSHNPEFRERALAAGCDVFMEKPLDLTLGIQTVKRLLGE